MKKELGLQKTQDLTPEKKLPDEILNDLREIIQKAQEFVASTINSSLTLLYWHIGDRIRREILHGERAEYGKSIITSLSQQLMFEYGNGFNNTNLHRMVKFSEIFPDKQIVASLTQQLS